MVKNTEITDKRDLYCIIRLFQMFDFCFCHKHSLKPNYMIYQSYQRKFTIFLCNVIFFGVSSTKKWTIFFLLQNSWWPWFNVPIISFSHFLGSRWNNQKKSFPSPSCLRRRFSWPLSIRSLGCERKNTEDRFGPTPTQKNWWWVKSQGNGFFSLFQGVKSKSIYSGQTAEVTTILVVKSKGLLPKNERTIQVKDLSIMLTAPFCSRGFGVG